MDLLGSWQEFKAVLSGEQLHLQEDIWQSLETFLMAIPGGEDVASVQWLETRNVAKHSAIHRLAPYNKEFSIQNDNCDAVQKHWSIESLSVIEQKPLQNSTEHHLSTPLLCLLGNKSLSFLEKNSKPGCPQPQVKTHCSWKKENLKYPLGGGR